MSLLAEADRLHREGAFERAVTQYRAAVAAEPSLAPAWIGLGCALASQGEHGAAIPALRRAVALNPAETWLRVNLGQSLFELGHVSASVAQYQAAIRDGDAEVRAMGRRNLALVAPGDPALDNAAILDIRRAWAAQEAAGVRPLAVHAPRQGRVRLAYYGAFFGRPNWMKMYMGVLNAHDRDRFELNLIVDGALPGPDAGYRGHDDDRIWEVTGLSNARLAGHVAEAGIEVLVDLNGYSHQSRLPLLLYRAAPVQVAWNGMYGTTGFPGLDLLVGDAAAIPPDEERFCTEPVARVPGSYLAFDMFYPTPPVAPPPCLQRGHITFGSLNSAYKLTDAVLACWARILHAVPGARLLLANPPLAHDSNRAELLARFAPLGIAPDRLDLLGGAEHAAFLGLYDRIDIALDVFPYNGGTTTAEALWQGVPVVACNGDRWAARTSRSILLAAGLPEYIAEDGAGYEALAIRLAGAPGALADRRARQRDRLRASPACDPAALCRALEALYLERLAAIR